MKSWKRITLAILVLIGGTTSFGYWSFNQFNQAFDELSASSIASTHSIYTSLKQRAGMASTTLEMSGDVATSTSSLDSAQDESGQATSTDLELAATTSGVVLGSTTSTAGSELAFIFPQKSEGVYIGCTYQISWGSSATINSLETALIDAGTREAMGPITSGLAKESVIEKDLQNLKWKVGNVWPGGYYVKVSKINGVEAEFRSKVFEINKMPSNIGTNEREIICKESGGSF